METLTKILNFDSSSWILQIFDHHWLIVGFIWGAFVIYAKRSKAAWDDAFVALVKGLNPVNRAKNIKSVSKDG